MGEMMRKKGQSKRARADKPKVDWKAVEVVHPHAAGIDIGGHEHWVAISPERDEEPVRRFNCFTADVEQMADWLVDRGVRSVATQSTGVYWMPVFEILQQHGLEVFLVNARKRRSAESGMGRKLFAVSEAPIIACTELWWNHRRLIQIPFSGHTSHAQTT